MEIIIVSGMSGSGKSNAVNVLDDAGYYCVDNMPPALIPNFINICVSSGGELNKLAFVADARGASKMDKYMESLEDLKKSGIAYRLIYLECEDEVLVSRYKEKRVKHPLQNMDNPGLEDAIARERVLMAPVKASADLVFDTSKMSAAQFREHFLKVLNKEKDSSFFVNVTSFGFKYGSPKDADIVFDVRCFPNPYWVAELKELTGLDSAVSDYVMSFEEAKMFIQKLQDMIEFMIPLYIKEGKPSLTVAIGCTGGKHRSVTFACRLAKYINDNIVTCLLNHRDINK
ncbi:MAG: RNase adapter RapZ [Clostridia bacterium]|nr:RNase adapter RapZ [Clostridia bacterium]